MTALLVVLGAAVGAPLRYLVARPVPGVPATFIVNVLGSLLIGLFAGLAPHPYALLGIGFCGAFTTYSAFAVEVVALPARRAIPYAVGSVVGCTLACAIGLALT